MVADTQSTLHRGSRGSPRFAQPQRDPHAPKPEPKETGRRCWQVIHSYRIGDGYSDITAICPLPGGVLVRTTSKNARGCSQAMTFVPGAKAADFATGGAR